MRDYLAAFELAAIYVTAPPTADTPIGIAVGTELPGTRRIAACWWADDLKRAHDVIDMVRGCDLRRAPRQGNLLAVTVAEASSAIAAAGRLSARLVDHATVVARATASVGRLDGPMAAAMSNGELQAFNRKFRRRRIEAAARQPFPTYNLALAKLRAALAGTIAGTKSPAELLRAVFDERKIR